MTMKRILTFSAAAILCLTAAAIPAKRGLFPYTLPDGSVIMIQNHGDEFYHYTTDRDGNVIELGGDGFFHPGQKPSNPETFLSIARRRAAMQARKKALTRASAEDFPMTFGTHRIPVLLVNFKDKSFKRSLKSILSIENLAGVISALLFLLYLAGNIMQPKPESARIGLSLVDYGRFPLVLLLQELSWGLWIVFLFKSNKKEPLLWAASICLFIFPFIEVGRFNDLCTRGSMPALLCLCVLLIRQLISVLERSEKRIIPLTALIFSLLLSGAFFIPEEVHLPDISKGILTSEHNWWGFNNSIEFYTMNDWTRYQYISWGENSISDFILR